MIDPKELRIGNYVFDKDWDAERPIGATDIYNMVIKGSDSFEPIELTPEWLEKFGFKKKDESAFENIKMKYWVHEAVCLFFNENPHEVSFLAGYGFNTFEGKYYGATIRWISHVHVLQNIFNSLTNKELTIKSFNQGN